jgi:ABC-type sugar transport system ATPase subunit
VMAMSDRMIIMASGKQMAELDRNEFEENKIMHYCFGYHDTRKAE